jgi:uncharacterized membrane protein
MHELNRLLLVLHFLGMAMGLAVPLSNLVLGPILARATPEERAVLARFPPRMVRVGDIGLVLLWASGVTLMFTKWGGFEFMPWQFHVKLTAVVLLTLTVGYLHSLMGKARRGNAAAAARMPVAGRIALLLALTAVVFAVLTFD